MDCLSSSVLSDLQCIVYPVPCIVCPLQCIVWHWRTDNTLKRTDNTLKRTDTTLEDRQYIEEDRQYIGQGIIPKEQTIIYKTLHRKLDWATRIPLRLGFSLDYEMGSVLLFLFCFMRFVCVRHMFIIIKTCIWPASFMTYYRVDNRSNTTGVNLSSTPVLVGFVLLNLVFCVMFCRLLFVLLVLSLGQCIVLKMTDNTLKRTDNTWNRIDNTLEDRQYTGGQTIHWHTDKTLEDWQYIGRQTINILSVHQCIVCPPMYCLSSNVLSVLQCIICPPMYCLSSNVLSFLQCIVCPPM
jgi:hypothetical protein